MSEERQLLREAARRILSAERDVAAHVEEAVIGHVNPSAPLTRSEPPADQTIEPKPAQEVEQIDLEAIVIREGRPLLAVVDDDIGIGNLKGVLWQPRLEAPGVREALRGVFPAVGRIEVDNHPDLAWLGTGWLVAPDILVTAGHMAREFASSSANGYLFKPGWPNQHNPMTVRVDFKREKKPGNPRPFIIREVLYIGDFGLDHSGGQTEPDLAFLRLEPSGAYGPLSLPLRLATKPPRAGQLVATVGYPAADPRLPQQLMRYLFDDVYEVKRLALGSVLSADEKVIRHDCTTAGGTGGSPIIDLQTGEVVGLHLGGMNLGEKYGIAAPWIADQLDKLRRSARQPLSSRMLSSSPSPAAVESAYSTSPSNQLAGRLDDALSSAFSFDELRRLASAELKVDLDTLAPRGTTRDAVKELVNWAEQSIPSRTNDLIAAALAMRPNNALIAALAPGTTVSSLPPDPSVIAGKQRQRLRGLLLDQFPKKPDLGMLLDDTLGQELDNVAGGDNHTTVCYALVKWLWVDRKGRLQPFLLEAIEMRPNCRELKTFLSEMGNA